MADDLSREIAARFSTDLFALWKDADEALPPLAEARAESARLR
jgi:hypothetical protein